MFTDTLCDNKILLFGQVEGNAHKYTDNKVWKKKLSCIRKGAIFVGSNVINVFGECCPNWIQFTFQHNHHLSSLY